MLEAAVVRVDRAASVDQPQRRIIHTARLGILVHTASAHSPAAPGIQMWDFIIYLGERLREAVVPAGGLAQGTDELVIQWAGLFEVGKVIHAKLQLMGAHPSPFEARNLSFSYRLWPDVSDQT